MADLIVIEELQAYLLAQGIGQRPSVKPSLVIPSMWLQPRDGAPLPRRSKDDGDFLENATITLNAGPLIIQPPEQKFLEESVVEIIVRARQNSQAQLIQRSIRGLIMSDPANPHNFNIFGRRDWVMNTLRLEYSTDWRPDQPLPQGDPDHFTYDRTQSFRFAARALSLAGMPYA